MRLGAVLGRELRAHNGLTCLDLYSVRARVESIARMVPPPQRMGLCRVAARKHPHYGIDSAGWGVSETHVLAA